MVCSWVGVLDGNNGDNRDCLWVCNKCLYLWCHFHRPWYWYGESWFFRFVCCCCIHGIEKWKKYVFTNTIIHESFVCFFYDLHVTICKRISQFWEQHCFKNIINTASNLLQNAKSDEIRNKYKDIRFMEGISQPKNIPRSE